jgi:hypothetical protein
MLRQGRCPYKRPRPSPRLGVANLKARATQRRTHGSKRPSRRAAPQFQSRPGELEHSCRRAGPCQSDEGPAQAGSLRSLSTTREGPGGGGPAPRAASGPIRLFSWVSHRPCGGLRAKAGLSLHGASNEAALKTKGPAGRPAGQLEAGALGSGWASSWTSTASLLSLGPRNRNGDRARSC